MSDTEGAPRATPSEISWRYRNVGRSRVRSRTAVRTTGQESLILAQLPLRCAALDGGSSARQVPRPRQQGRRGVGVVGRGGARGGGGGGLTHLGLAAPPPPPPPPPPPVAPQPRASTGLTKTSRSE